MSVSKPLCEKSHGINQISQDSLVKRLAEKRKITFYMVVYRSCEITSVRRRAMRFKYEP